MKQIPPNSVKFVLSDDIREEAHGKMTIVGLYADDKIFVEMKPAVPLPPGIVTVVNLSIACMMFGGAGNFNIKAEITGPAWQPITQINGTQDFIPGATATFVLKGAPIALPQYGAYLCKITVQQKVFSYTFEVWPGPPASLTAATAVRRGRRRSARP